MKATIALVAPGIFLAGFSLLLLTQQPLQAENDTGNGAEAAIPAAFNMQAEPWIEEIRAKENGVLEQLSVVVGDRVREGDLLGHLEDSRQRHAYEVAKLQKEDDSNVRVAEATLSMRSAELREEEAKMRRRQASDNDVQKALAQVSMAEARRDSAVISQRQRELQYQQALHNLEQRRVRAPMDGIILDVREGPGSNVRAGDHIITIIDPARVRMNTAMPVTAARSLQLGQAIPVRQGSSGMHRLARVTSIKPDPDSETGEQIVTLSMDHPPNQHPIAPDDYEMEIPKESTAMFPY